MLFKTRRFFKEIGNNIAFIPAILGLAGVIIAMLMYYLESLGISGFLIDKVPALVVNNYNTASTLLSTFSAGVLSILVFSFSMVMLLLNQAGGNFSPRVLPGLISVKKHQYVIGLFLATILYNAIVLIGLKPSNNQYQLPGFSVLIGILLTVVCLFAFIYFIDSISKSIQVQNILSKIFDAAYKRMNVLQQQSSEVVTGTFEKDFKHTYFSTKSGYLHDFNEDLLISVAQSQGLKIQLLCKEGSFVLKGEPLFCCDSSLDDEIAGNILEGIVINRSGENVSDNYLLGFKQISEIGLRAMSPGINDPATAITTIDFLTELFSVQMYLSDDERIIQDEVGTARIIIPTVKFSDLLYQVMVEYRMYCKSDMSCSQKLAMMLNTLEKLPQTKSVHKNAIQRERNLLLQDVKKSLSNEYDFQVLEKLMIH